MPARFRGLLFIVALVICQFSLLQHQLDIAHHADGKPCTICLASQGLDHALAGAFPPLPVPALVEARHVLMANVVISRTPVRRVARSPPVFILHA